MKSIKKILCLALVVIMCFSCMFIPTQAVSFNDINQSSVFVKQQTGKTCTLASAVMLVRRTAMAAGNSNWSSITESAMRSTAWLEGTGLYFSFTYAGVSVGHSTISSNKKSTYINLLNTYPQGVVAYNPGNNGQSHAVLLTDYDSSTDTFYCADPSNAVASGRIPLSSSSIVGSGQDGKINNLSAYWYVKSPSVSLDTNAPTQANISIDKTFLKIGEEFVLTLTSDVSCGYYLSIFDLDSGEKIIGESVSSSYKNSFQKAGHYTAYMSATNSNGTKDSNWIDFYVFGDKPTTATLTADKTVLAVGESVKFTTSTDSYYVKICTSILKGDEKVYSGDIPYTFTYTPQSEGVYRMWISAYTHEGGVDSNSVVFYVGKYNVKYDLNGGDGSFASQTKIYGKDLKLSESKPTRSGYEFCGWATSSTASKAAYLPGSNYTTNKDVTLYAVWAKNHSHSYTSSVTKQPTHTEEGVTTYTCSCGDTYTEPIDKLADHSYTSSVTKQPTHTEEGVTTYTCSCGDIYTEPIKKLEDHSYTSSVTTQPTCTSEGVRTYTCSCGVSYTEKIKMLNHVDGNADGKCDNCGTNMGTVTPSDPSKNCSCNCHKTGLAHFFFVIINFFQKLFGKNKVCTCGAKH